MSEGDGLVSKATVAIALIGAGPRLRGLQRYPMAVSLAPGECGVPEG